MNARISNKDDFVTLDISTHIDALPEDYVCDINLTRATQDKICNANGSLLLDLCRKNWISSSKWKDWRRCWRREVHLCGLTWFKFN